MGRVFGKSKVRQMSAVQILEAKLEGATNQYDALGRENSRLREELARERASRDQVITRDVEVRCRTIHHELELRTQDWERAAEERDGYHQQVGNAYKRLLDLCPDLNPEDPVPSLDLVLSCVEALADRSSKQEAKLTALGAVLPGVQQNVRLALSLLE